MKEQAQLTDSELELLSRSMDEDLSELELKRLSKHVLSKAESDKTWARYHAVSAVMQKQFPANMDKGFSDRVMRAIESDDQQYETTETADVTSTKVGVVGSYMKQFAGIAVAASVAAVSIVVYQQQTQPGLVDGGSSIIVSDKREIEDFQPNAAADVKSVPVEFSPVQIPVEDDIIGLSNAENTEENFSDLPEEDIIELEDIK